MISTPVLFIVFNRPGPTEKVFESIRKAAPLKLYIASDAPRMGNESDEVNCAQVKKIINKVDWNCDVKRLYHEKNLGCSYGVQSAFNWFFKFEERGIILEDDCLPSLSFFQFCEEMLEKYNNDEEVISINGSNLGYNLNNGYSYTFSRFFNMWGWATWRRSAEKINYGITDWKHNKRPLFTIYKHIHQNIFDFDLNWYKYWKNKFDLISHDDKITWDWQWVYYQIMNNKKSVVPAINMVTNIGFNENATHTKTKDNPSSNIKSFELKFPLVHPSNKLIDIEYEEKYIKWIWCFYKRLPLFFYIKHYIFGRIK